MRARSLFALAAAGMLLAGGGSTASANGYSDPCSESLVPTKSLNAPGTLNGTSGDDILIGSPGDDVINGKGGNDIICGNGGNDHINGGSGNDHMSAVGESDIKGSSGDDVIWLNALTTSGVEPINAGGSADGGSGNDVIYAGPGSVANGGSGNDEIFSSYGMKVYGGSGNDLIEAIETSDLVDCGPGKDNFFFKWIEADPRVKRCEQTIT